MKWQKLISKQNVVIFYLELSLLDDPDLTYHHIISVPKQKSMVFEIELEKQNQNINLKKYGEVIKTGEGSLNEKEINNYLYP